MFGCPDLFFRPGYAGDAARRTCRSVRNLLWAGWLLTIGTHALADPSAERGRTLLLQRHETGCILCHTVPGLPNGGNLGPALTDLGARYSPPELRARIADARQFNPQTVMPPYFSTAGLSRVAPAFAARTILSGQGLDDIVAYLLRAPAAAPAPGTDSGSGSAPESRSRP